MKVAVRYFSRTGNTKKIADAIAEKVGVEAKTTDVALEENVDILFLGSAMYAAGVDPAISEFVKTNASKIGKIASFSTTAVASSTIKLIKKIAAENNVQVLDQEFSCKGKFTLLHTNRPNEKDLDAAKEFAESVIKK